MDSRIDPPSAFDRSVPAACPSRPAFERFQIQNIFTGLSQELCCPLGSLRSGIELLLNDPRASSKPEHGHLQTMTVLCDDLIRLTHSYLDYAALLHGTRPLHLGAYTLRAIANDLDQEFSSTAASRGVHWTCGLDGPDAVIVTDASRCQQIFGNLVGGALKCAPGGSTLSVAIRHDGDLWSVTIVESAPGMLSHHARQLSGTAAYHPDKPAGAEETGLSLALCRALLDQLGGATEIEAEPDGRRTRLTVRFPIAAAASAVLPG